MNGNDATRPIQKAPVLVDQSLIEEALRIVQRHRPYARAAAQPVGASAGEAVQSNAAPEQQEVAPAQDGVAADVTQALQAVAMPAEDTEQAKASIPVMAAPAAAPFDQTADETAPDAAADEALAGFDIEVGGTNDDDDATEPTAPAAATLRPNPVPQPDARFAASSAQASVLVAPLQPITPLATATPLPVDAGVSYSPAETNALYMDTFFAELERCGVVDYVISPGSRSTALAMKAYERFSSVYVHVDERGAAFFALGLAKAKGKPVAVICTSGTAVANWMPAVLEAEASRVPVLFLSSDRPARLQHLGAPQTCDQIKLFSDHVKMFAQMPEPSTDIKVLDYVRQMALEACLAAHGAAPGMQSCDGGPVHLNFPFDEPLLPSPRVRNDAISPLPATVFAGQGMLPSDVRGMLRIIAGKRVVALCGEGTVRSAKEVATLVEFAHKLNIPLIADPLSGMRVQDDLHVLDAYDAFTNDGYPAVDVVIRFGRWPVSKRLCTALQAARPTQIVVDMRNTRDFSSTTSLFVHATAAAFAEALSNAPYQAAADERGCAEWINANAVAAERLRQSVQGPRDGFEGAYVANVFDLAPVGSAVFCANSMSVRAVDRYYRKSSKSLRVLGNRGLNGIDGTLATAMGTAYAYHQTTLITGDLALLHDLNSLAFQNEMRVREMRGDGPAPSLIIVLLNNNGGAIFDMLPQKSQDDYFERLFLTPQNVNFKQAAKAFGVPYQRTETILDFRDAYARACMQAGMTLIEVPLPLAGVVDRYSLR